MIVNNRTKQCFNQDNQATPMVDQRELRTKLQKI